MGDFLIEVPLSFLPSLLPVFLPSHLPTSLRAGQRSERSEGGPPAGGQHDPAGRQQPNGQGSHGDPQPGHGGGLPEEE